MMTDSGSFYFEDNAHYIMLGGVSVNKFFLLLFLHG